MTLKDLNIGETAVVGTVGGEGMTMGTSVTCMCGVSSSLCR